MVAAIDHPDIRESESHIMVSPESALTMDARRGRVIITRILPRSTPARLHTSGDLGHESPHEPSELPRHRDDRDARITSRDETPVAGVEPNLGTITMVHDLVGLSLVAASEAGTNVGSVSVRPSGLDQYPPDVTIAGLGYGSAVLAGPARVFGRHKPGKGHEARSVAKAAEVANLGREGRRRQCVDASQTAKVRDGLGERF